MKALAWVQMEGLDSIMLARDSDLGSSEALGDTLTTAGGHDIRSERPKRLTKIALAADRPGT